MNSIMLTFVQVITTLFGIIVTKLLSVNFSLQEYGTYSQALLLTTTVTSVSILGLTNATNYFYNRTKDKGLQHRYIATIFNIQYIVGITCSFILFFLRYELAAYLKNDDLIDIIPIVALTPFFTNLIAMFQTLFVSIGKARIIAIRNLIVSLIKMISVVISCYVLNSIITVLVVILILDFIQVIYFYELFKGYEYPIHIREGRLVLVKEILNFSIPMSVYVLTNTLSRDIDKYIISIFANTETLAIYTNAAKVLPFDMLTASMITVLVPVITRMINQSRYKEAQEVFRLYLKIGCIITCIFVGGAIFLSRDLMVLLYDEKYLEGLPVFVLYLVVDMIRFANVTTILSGAGKTKILMTISIITLICNSILNVLGYKMMGMIGPAFVTLLLTIFMTLALLHFGAKEIHTKIEKLFDFKEIGKIVVEIMLVGVVVYFISVYLNSLRKCNLMIFSTCYGIYLIIMGVMNYKKIISYLKSLNKFK